MGVDLFDVAGLDGGSAEAQAAREDAEEFERLIRALLQARKTSGSTQVEVARRMGTRQSAVSTLEGLGSDPRYSTLQRYARAAGVRIRTVVLDDE